MKILVAEDEPGIAGFLQRALESEGFSVKCTADGEAAQALALSGDYELLLLDLMLPRRSGLEVLEAVAERGRAAGYRPDGAGTEAGHRGRLGRRRR